MIKIGLVARVRRLGADVAVTTPRLRWRLFYVDNVRGVS